MRIVVCVKQVPEVSELSLDPVTHRLVREGVPNLINPFDRRAVLEAVRLRGELGGSVCVLSMGPPQAAEALRECLGLTVDRAVHLSDPRFAGADTLATSRALADAISRIGFDLVLAGRSSIDSETGQVGPEIASLLDVPLLAGVRRLQISPTPVGGAWRALAECEGDHGFVEVESILPAVATCTDRWKSRIPRILPDDAAATGPIEVWGVDDLAGPPSAYGAAGSPTWVAGVEPVAVSRERRRVVFAGAEARATELAWQVAGSVRAKAQGDGVARLPRHAHFERDAADVWVLGERDHVGGLRPVTAELLAAADELALLLGGRVTVALLEPPSAGEEPPRDRRLALEPLAGELGRLGADRLLVPASDAIPTSTLGLSAWLAERIAWGSPRMVLAPATALGREVTPWVAARLGLGLTGDAIGVRLDGEGRLQQLKPAFGGQVVAPILSRTRPEMATLRPGVFAALAPDVARAPAEIVFGPPFEDSTRVRRLRLVAEVGPEGAALEEARAVVCVGYGLGQEAIPLAAALAERLGGVLAATRRVCDVGWLPRQLQIGISGRTVSPGLYVALGVRGSFNHVVGMQRAGRVIAVNTDSEAEIFAAADLGIVGDAADVVRALLGAPPGSARARAQPG